MENISYEKYESEPSFENVENIVNSLSAMIYRELRLISDVNESEIKSACKEVSFDAFEKDDIYTMNEIAEVTYLLEKDDVYLRVSGEYNTKSSQLERTVIQVNMGVDSFSTVLDFIVTPDGAYETNIIIFQDG